ncbi:MAG: hypothetical protein K2X86_13830 [Cytophagaceae bacterium]|nr:hypothetical protein [Cytophagaceae bacterium]
MKQTLLIACFALLCFSALSQDVKLLKNGVVMKDGKPMGADKSGVLTPLEEDVTLGNGTVVSKTGEYKLPGGKKLKLKNGEAFNANGDMLVLEDEMISMDGYVMKDGALMQVKGGIMTAQDQDVDFESGDKLMKDGTIMRKDGATMVLRDGEMISSKGEVMRRKDDLLNMDGVTMRNGKMMKWEANKLIAVDKEIALSNGAKVAPNGTITMKDGSKLTLNNGEIFTSKGEIVIAKSDLLSDALIKRDGNMMLLQNGKVKTLSEDMTLPNGSVISSKGILSTSSGSKIILREGDVVSMNGDIFISKIGKLDDGDVAQRTSNDHMFFEAGKVMMVKDGQTQVLLHDMTMPNGNKVLKTGQIVKKDGSKYALKEGERIDMNGEIMQDKDKQAADERNHVGMKNGKMYIVKEGKELPLVSDVYLADWSKVLPDGNLVKENGQKIQIKEGERFNMDGVPMAKLAGTATTAAATDCLTLKGGKMCIVKSGQTLPMTKEQVMPNGSKVMPNGTVLKKDGKTITLKEGDKVDMKGEYIPKQ